MCNMQYCCSSRVLRDDVPSRTRISRLPESTCAGEVTRRKNEKLTDIDIEKHPFSPPLSPCSRSGSQLFRSSAMSFVTS